MPPFQVATRSRLADLASEFQLNPYDLLESGNGTEYKNYTNETVFTVYHARLDAANSGGLEVAFSIENATRELSLSPDIGQNWLARLLAACPPAESKSPLFWPRVGIRSEEDVESFERAVRALYATTPGPSTDHLNRTTQPPSSRPVQSIDERVLRAIFTRRGQPAFRAALLTAYRGACAVSGCTDEAVLEAAHIVPHAEQEDYRIANGILLRADIHTLFDLQLLSIDPSAGRIVVATGLSVQYTRFHGEAIHLPDEPSNYPDPLALMQHYQAWRTRRDA